MFVSLLKVGELDAVCSFYFKDSKLEVLGKGVNNDRRFLGQHSAFGDRYSGAKAVIACGFFTTIDNFPNHGSIR